VTNVTIRQMPPFKKAYKKLHSTQKQIVDDAIRAIAADPKIGQEKKGDLAGVYVHKFKIHHQEILLAYEWYSHDRLLLALGTHENFYRDLKKRR
jgi:mRNA interferase RelE/StbE